MTILCIIPHGNIAALYDAAFAGEGERVQRLLENGIHPREYKGFNKKSPLHAAAGKGHTEIVQMLIKAGACVEVQDAFGATPLHLASIHGHLAVVKALFQVGGKACLLVPHGPEAQTSVQLARENGHTDVAEFIHYQLEGKLLVVQALRQIKI